MRIYVMTDMEGVAGMLDHDNWCQPASERYAGRFYAQGRRLLTEEVNACVRGLLAGGATEIVVSDGHGAGGIDPELLHPRAQLLRGWPRGWPLELDATFDAVAWVGQHAKAGTPLAHMAHTQWFDALDLSINGLSIGELGQFALCALELGVPCIFASGDEALCREAEALIEGIETVAVKRGLQPDAGATLCTREYMRHNLAAIHLSPVVARQRIEQGARTAIERLASDRAPFRGPALEPPYELVAVKRPQEPGGSRPVSRATHPSSVAALLNLPGAD
jgi:D-amino peptidase